MILLQLHNVVSSEHFQQEQGHHLHIPQPRTLFCSLLCCHTLVEGWCWSLVEISRNLDVSQNWYGCQVVGDGLLESVV